MAESEKKKKSPPKLNPYVFTVLLFLFGVWCFYDGWISMDPDMQEHKLFNQIASGILLPWAIYDFFKVRKKMRKRNNSINGGNSPGFRPSPE